MDNSKLSIHKAIPTLGLSCFGHKITSSSDIGEAHPDIPPFMKGYCGCRRQIAQYIDAQTGNHDQAMLTKHPLALFEDVELTLESGYGRHDGDPRLIRCAKTGVDTRHVLVPHDAVIEERESEYLVEAWVRVPKDQAATVAALECRIVDSSQVSSRH